MRRVPAHDLLIAFSCLAIAPLLFGCSGGKAESSVVVKEEAATSDGTEGESDAAPLSAQEILNSIEEKVVSIEDYHYISKSIERLGDQTDEKVLDIWFKRPDLFRSLVVEGANEGGTVTQNRDGVIHGKKGGVLGLIVLTLEADDERIRGLRGRRFFETGWEQEVEEIKGRVTDGWQLERLEDKRIDETDCYVLKVSGTSEDSAETEEQVWVDRDSYLLKRRQAYEGDTLVRDVVYTQIEINLDTPDEQFSLK